MTEQMLEVTLRFDLIICNKVYFIEGIKETSGNVKPDSRLGLPLNIAAMVEEVVPDSDNRRRFCQQF